MRVQSIALAVAFLGLTVSAAAPTIAAPTPTPASFGKTNDFDGGRLFEDVYSRGYYCDTSIPAMSTTGCEVGAAYKHPPASNFDPLYITVPLGFTASMRQMQCPDGITCVDHPPTIDLSLIGGPTNAMTPGHDHFTTTTNNYMPEWWNVVVIGVKNQATYQAIAHYGTYAYMEKLIARKDPNITPPIPTNLFLYFAVVPPGSE